jgi:aminopeptidase
VDFYQKEYKVNNIKHLYPMNNLDLLARYSDLIVRVGANVQPGQIVNVTAEAYHRELALRLVRKAYECKAAYVNLDLVEPRVTRERILHSSPEDLKYIPSYVESKYRELVDSQAAVIRLIGPEYPEVLADLDPGKVNSTRMAQYQAMKYFYDEGISHSKVQWTIAAAATPEWAKRVFPSLTGEEAEAKLWEAIFETCRVNRDDYLNQWKLHDITLLRRAEKLTQMGIESLHFTGPGTDLIVGLSPMAVFRGGSQESAKGFSFQANLPTEECFTTPDFRRTSGTVRATRPFLINGKLIRNLEVRFEEGNIVDFHADDGEPTFREYIHSDSGAKRLGEVALVGVDSPIYQSRIIFEEILFDENAACHIAIGSAYKFCLEGGTQMSKDELESVGCNESSVHTDIMISNERVDVTANLRSGEKVALLTQGKWADQ